MIKFRKTALIFVFCLAFLMVAIGTGLMIGDKKKKFDKNIQIDGVNVGGLTTQTATKVVADKMQKKLDDLSITLKYQNKTWLLDNFQVDDGIKQVVNSVFKTTKFGDKDAINFVSQNSGSFNTAISAVCVDFENQIDKIAQEIETDPQNAFVTFCPNKKQMFEITPEKYGIKVDRKKLIDDIENQFLSQQNILVSVPVSLIEPNIKKDFFDDKLNLQSKFSTSIKGSQAGRRNNVKVALQKISGTVIMPNEQMSFNSVTSPQDATGGYQDAIIIKNGKFVNGIGGGICQASTTVYNACLLAGLEIEEVHKHTLPVHYVEPALDAMVSGYADLVVKNTSENPVYIKGYVNGDDACVEIYGKSLPDGVTIKRTSEITKKLLHKGDKVVVDTKGEYANKVLYKGEFYRLKYPKDGYEATAFVEYYQNGEMIKKEQIRTERYDAEQGILIEGALDLPEGFVLPEQTETIIPPKKQ